MRALVTGGAGFLGSHVVDALIADGHEVAVIDDLSGGFRENLNPHARFYEVSITEAKAVEAIFQECRFDYVYHLAAYAAEGLSHYIRSYNYTNNVLGSVNLINSAVRHSVRCFVFTSSIAVYGSGQTPFTEEMTPQPEDPYGIAKYAVELDLAAAHRQFGLDYIIFRPHNVYGERQNLADPYRNVVGIFMNQILRGQPLTIFGDGTQTRAFTYFADVSHVIAASIHYPAARNQIFNIGAGTVHSVNELAEEVRIVMGQPTSPILYLPARNEVQHAFSDHRKVDSVFGTNVKVSTPLAEGLRYMARWAKSVGVRQPKPFTSIELDRGLPESWRKEEHARHA